MNIRPADSGDLSDIQNINTVIGWPYEHHDDFYLECIGHDQCFVAESDDEVVGYFCYQMLWGNTAFLSLVKVLPDHQRQGIGTALMTYAEDMLRERGEEYYLSSSEVVNTAGQSWHSKNHYESVGTLDLPWGQETFYKKMLN